jgi:hypothetical protein
MARSGQVFSRPKNEPQRTKRRQIEPRIEHGLNTDKKKPLVFIRVSSVFNPWLYLLGFFSSRFHSPERLACRLANVRVDFLRRIGEWPEPAHIEI